jgi:hypothetical protein
MVKQAVMEPVLIDRCQFILQRLVEEFDDFCVALNGRSLRVDWSLGLHRDGTVEKLERPRKAGFIADNLRRYCYAVAAFILIMSRANGKH